MSRLPFELLLALRYLRPKRTFVSIITLISILGVMLGVAVLIIVISVMSGFDHDLREKVYCLAAGFQSLGIKKGDRIALLSEGRNNWVIAELAILYAGAVAGGIWRTNNATAASFSKPPRSTSHRGVVKWCSVTIGSMPRARSSRSMTR